ncbi:MAG: 1-acyl-sn-glycerol-3-phosphate acyltransferase [Rikenellaceae bacterium]|nr:1-acyl-sn-glycerol-3-phosphate acyltransferase [Rikenellaceae bacterium]
MFTLLFAIYTFVICTVMLLLSVVAFVLTVPFDKQRKVVHELSRALVYMFVMVPPMWRRRVEGLEHIEKDKPYVIVINHQSMVDIMMLYLVPMIFRWVSKREAYRIPFIGRFLLLHGDITIDRKQGSKAMRKVMEKGQMWLGRGVSVSMFPEGTRSKDGEIHRFKAGAFALAKEAGVGILPVVMDGSTTMFKPSMMVNWRNEFVIRVLPPVTAEEVAQTDQSELMEQVRERMVDALAEIRKK